uniref:DNA topoisomerase VI subunit B transducer domain-containing protein n=1 Tax=Lactuca sativa TaxID=4236 RepID=A0A9R1XUM8_LACSA|nr:hypothetical protein LSAT_V11C100048460 [Lactuca sativa]
MESGGSKGESKTTGKRKASDLNQKSPLVFSESLAEFFAENTNIAGFDDPGKSLYSTVRELVENALDSAESIQELPLVEVTIITGPPTPGLQSSRSTLRASARLVRPLGAYSLSGPLAGPSEQPVRPGYLGLQHKAGPASTQLQSKQPCAHIHTIRNIPHIHLHEKIGGNENWHGAEIKVVIDGNWKTYGSKILEYMRQMAVITPYAEFKFRFVAVTPNENGVVEKSYSRLTEEMPPVPVETKYHPSAVDSLHIIQRLIGQTKNQNLLDFLQHEFVNIPKAQAKRLIAKMAPDVTSETQVNSLTLQQIACMNQLFQHTKFDDPSGNCLAPLGDESFCEGIYKVLQPKMVATYTAKSAQVYQGHPFIVEAGVSMGGKCFKQGINIFLFANRVPLLFEQDADVVTTTATKRIKWERYKIFKRQEKIGVFVNIVSTKIPFKGSGMAKAVKTCLEDCCNQLRSLDLKRNMSFYIDQAATACASITEIGRDLNGPDTKVWTKEELVRDFREDCKKVSKYFKVLLCFNNYF